MEMQNYLYMFMGRVFIPMKWNGKNVIPLHTENGGLF